MRPTFTHLSSLFLGFDFAYLACTIIATIFFNTPIGYLIKETSNNRRKATYIEYVGKLTIRRF